MRLSELPQVPVMANFVPGYEASGWIGIGAPENTPAEIVEKLNQEIGAALADPNFKTRLDETGGLAFANSPVEFRKFIAEEVDKWGMVIRTANIKPE
jgi:tripartite-type tricarboxylate transporter receptor subunit TctC